MKKTLVLFLLSLHLFSTTELREVMKLPVLFQHYFEHKELDQGITFSCYLADHYNSVPHTDDDEARDNQLPFKSANFNGFLSPAIASIDLNKIKRPVPLLIFQKHIIYDDAYLPNNTGAEIWQPPKAILTT